MLAHGNHKANNIIENFPENTDNKVSDENWKATATWKHWLWRGKTNWLKACEPFET